MAKVGPKQHWKWWMMVAQTADDTACYTIEDMGDQHGLGVTQRRSRIHDLITKLTMVYDPTKEAPMS